MAAKGMLAVGVDLPGPLDVPGSLDFLARHGDDRIDRWDGATLVRVLPVGGHSRPVAMTADGDLDAPRLLVETPVEPGEPADETALRSAVAAQFVTANDAITDLAARDTAIGRLLARLPGIRVLLQPHLLHALVRSISAQQVNLAWATTTRARLVELVGTPHRFGSWTAYEMDAHRLAATPPAALRALQFTTAKATTSSTWREPSPRACST
jgi:DNA-3-methyladenine glycosylase II